MRSIVAAVGLTGYFALAVFLLFFYVPLFFIRNFAVGPELSMRYAAATGVVFALLMVAVTAAQSLMARLSPLFVLVVVLAGYAWWLTLQAYPAAGDAYLFAVTHIAIAALGGGWALFQYGKLRKAED